MAKSKKALFIAGICILVLATITVFEFNRGEKDNNSEVYADQKSNNQIDQVNETEDTEKVESLVANFGQKLKMVSVLAPEDILIESIEEHYSEFISPGLLEKWKENPQSVPGRFTSSPWPERIEILSTNRISKDKYEVEGEIIEVTSSDMSSEEAASKIPVVLTIIKNNEKWVIDDVIIDEHSIYGN